MESSRGLEAVRLMDFGGAAGRAGLYWAVDEASVPALSCFCAATLLQLLQIDVQPGEEVIVRLTGKALDDRALQSHLLLFDAQLDFLDAAIGEDDLVKSRHTRLQTLFGNGYGW